MNTLKSPQYRAFGTTKRENKINLRLADDVYFKIKDLAYKEDICITIWIYNLIEKEIKRLESEDEDY